MTSESSSKVLELPTKFLAEEKITFDGKVVRFTSNAFDFELGNHDIKNCRLNIKDKSSVQVTGDVMTITTTSGILKLILRKQTNEAADTILLMSLDVKCKKPKKVFGLLPAGYRLVYSYDGHHRYYDPVYDDFIPMSSWYSEKIRTLERKANSKAVETHTKKFFGLS